MPQCRPEHRYLLFFKASDSLPHHYAVILCCEPALLNLSLWKSAIFAAAFDCFEIILIAFFNKAVDFIGSDFYLFRCFSVKFNGIFLYGFITVFSATFSMISETIGTTFYLNSALSFEQINKFIFVFSVCYNSC